MKVLHLTHGDNCAVWLMCTDDESCQVLDVLVRVNEEHPDLVAMMTALLHGVVPNEGPPLHDEFRAKRLFPEFLFELKADKDLPRRKHLGLRIMFFFVDDQVGGRVVVCTNAFTKEGSTTPQGCIDEALIERSRFYEEREEMEFIFLEVPL